MFDSNEDKGIDEKDLEIVLDTLNKGNKFNADQKGTIVHNIMSESAQGKGVIYEAGSCLLKNKVDFQKVFNGSILSNCLKIDFSKYRKLTK